MSLSARRLGTTDIHECIGKIASTLLKEQLFWDLDLYQTSIFKVLHHSAVGTISSLKQGGGILLRINIDHLSLQLSARQLIRLLGFSTISCLLSSSQVKRSSNWEYCLQGGFHVTSHPASFLFLHQKNVSFSSQEWVCHSRLCLLTREGSKTLGHWGTTRTTL